MTACVGSSDELCTIRRGRRTQVELCTDEMPTYGATSALESYDSSELYLVEVYNRGQQVRVYTRWFLEHALRGGAGDCNRWSGAAHSRLEEAELAGSGPVAKLFYVEQRGRPILRCDLQMS